MIIIARGKSFSRPLRQGDGKKAGSGPVFNAGPGYEKVKKREKYLFF